MNTLWQIGCIMGMILDAAYVLFPRRVYQFGLGSLRYSSSTQSVRSDYPVWLYRAIGVCLLLICTAGMVQ